MHKKPCDFTYRTIIFLLILLAGCLTAGKKPLTLNLPEKQIIVEPKRDTALKQNVLVKKKAKKEIMKDVLVFRDLKQIDLDGDGIKEIVAVCTTKSNLGAVKVIKIINEKIGNIISSQTFNTSNIKFRISKGSPFIFVKEKAYLFGLGLNSVYQWNGKTFIYLRKTVSL